MLRSLSGLLFVFLSVTTLHAQAPKQVMVLGVFHFATNLDAVKHKEIDVSTPERQQELEDLNVALTRFAPDRIMVEWVAVEDQPWVDSTYAEYVADRFPLRANEVYQIGYRLARSANAGPPQCIDAPGAFLYDTLLIAAALNGQADLFKNYMDSLVSQAMTDDTLRSEMSISEALLRMNMEEADVSAQAINGVYIAPRLGPLGDLSGAEFLGQWYLRNIRMYSNICRSTRAEDERVLVIVGNGHRPIIEQLLRSDPAWEVVKADGYLR
jgi:hypothetical protein